MIRKYSTEWAHFLGRLEQIKVKSNRDVLCLDCWNIFNYEQKTRHLLAHPSHRNAILTSKDFASEPQIIALSNAQNKFVQRDELTFIVDPFLKSPDAFSPPPRAPCSSSQETPSIIVDRNSASPHEAYFLTNKRLQKLERKTRALESKLKLLCRVSVLSLAQKQTRSGHFGHADAGLRPSLAPSGELAGSTTPTAHDIFLTLTSVNGEVEGLQARSPGTRSHLN